MARKRLRQPGTDARLDQLVERVQRERKERAAGYREQALKLFPWVCARCGRSFTTKTVRELTVHHRDHDHDHNPPDGSNWELLCLYCHDNEHSRQLETTRYGTESRDREFAGAATYKAFADLARLIRRDD
jgi:hypothetical protein